MAISHDYVVNIESKFSHSVERIWDFIVDIEQANRFVGYPAVRYEFLPLTQGGTVRVGSFGMMGLKNKWEEKPLEWVKYESFSLERNYLSGPLKSLSIKIRASNTPHGSLVHTTISYKISHRFFLPWMYLEISIFLKNGLQGYYSHIDKNLLKDANTELFFSSPFIEKQALDSLTRKQLKERLRQSQVEEGISEKLLDFISRAQERDLYRIRPFVFARYFGIGRISALLSLLKATQAGVLTLAWDVLCPSCRVDRMKGTRIADLKTEAHCEICNIHFDNDISRLVELTFTPHTSVRKVTDSQVYEGAPRNTSHTIVQHTLKPGEIFTVRHALGPGFYRLRSLQSPKCFIFEISLDGQLRRDPFCFTDNSEIEQSNFLSPQDGFVIENKHNHDVTMTLEEQEWMNDACTAAQVAAIPEFRQSFASHLVELDQQIELSAVAILFTDLKGSIALYESMGDSEAFVLIQRHFNILKSCLEKYEGGIIKTIGDSAMAGFAKPEQALLAGIELQERFTAKLKEWNYSEEILVKVGIHYGPCFLVFLNSQIDYFGTSVNLASRIVNLCEGGKIMISAKMMDDPVVRSVLKKHHIQSEQFIYSPRGFKNDIEAYVLELPPKDLKH